MQHFSRRFSIKQLKSSETTGCQRWTLNASAPFQLRDPEVRVHQKSDLDLRHLAPRVPSRLKICCYRAGIGLNGSAFMINQNLSCRHSDQTNLKGKHQDITRLPMEAKTGREQPVSLASPSACWESVQPHYNPSWNQFYRMICC